MHNVVIDWEKELTSMAFTSRLRKIISFTNETGSEAGFSVNYCPELSSLVHSRKIHVGTRNRIDFEHPINLDTVLDTYKSSTGMPTSGMNMSQERALDQWIARYTRIHPHLSLRLDFFDEAARLDEKRMREYAEWPLFFDGGDTAYAIGVHTHPERNVASPSFQDL